MESSRDPRGLNAMLQAIQEYELCIVQSAANINKDGHLWLDTINIPSRLRGLNSLKKVLKFLAFEPNLTNPHNKTAAMKTK